MNKKTSVRSRAWFSIVACVMAFALQSCSSVDPGRVKQEDGYVYGYGKGGSPEEAELEAKRDLIANALESSMRKRSGEARRVTVTQETARGISLETKRVAELKGSDSTSVTLRVSEADWEKFESRREAAIRKELAPSLSKASSSRPFAERVAEAIGILAKLEAAGVDGLLSAEEGGDALLSDALAESLSRDALSLTVSLSPDKGILAEGATVTARLADASGAGIEGVPLSASWSRQTAAGDAGTSGEAGAAGDEGASLEAPAVGAAPVAGRTGANGEASFRLPSGANSPSVFLRVTTAFASRAPSAAPRSARRLASIDERISAGATFVTADDLAGRFGSFVRVEAGKFAMGAAPGDKRASKREAARTAETGVYAIAAKPVTNEQYRMFLDATGYANVPEFLDNPEYTMPDQPVVGVTRADAEAFASWLSGVLGSVVRLPSEAEWEKAAKAGGNTVFPWGDESAADGDRANYRGNPRFKRPSPAGSFPNGANPWGLHDMAGNVWELLASPAGEPQIAKGGSWMEGPNDLRISNRREIDPARTYADVGFRVVMEVAK